MKFDNIVKYWVNKNQTFSRDFLLLDTDGNYHFKLTGCDKWEHNVDPKEFIWENLTEVTKAEFFTMAL